MINNWQILKNQKKYQNILHQLLKLAITIYKTIIKSQKLNVIKNGDLKESYQDIMDGFVV